MKELQENWEEYLEYIDGLNRKHSRNKSFFREVPSFEGFMKWLSTRKVK